MVFTDSTTARQLKRLHIELQGVVQGVGMRPLCYRLAQRYGLTGWVLNHSAGVSVEVQGERCEAFVQALRDESPPLASIEGVAVDEIASQPESSFVIRHSQAGDAHTAIAVDSAVCPACLQELFDPDSRYFHYPFLNCTQCGPRYTVIERLPYDRDHTALKTFAMCAACQQEFNNPADRRFHAQPTACPACGPQLDASVESIVEKVRAGEVLAIKGLGGFHLVCDARNSQAVKHLRERKHRYEKPLAIMAANLVSLEQFVELDDAHRQLLSSPERSIVLAPKGEGSQQLASELAPGLNSLGVMLPYTPLHYLLFNHASGLPNGTQWLDQINELVLVMTSANPTGEPLVIDNAMARKQLAGIADTIVCHNRDIVTRADDSVLHVVNGAPTFIRRARGYVPTAIKLAHELPPILATGGYLKNSVCVVRGNEAFVSQHIGDLDSRATIAFFEETVHYMLDMLGVQPQYIAHDLHPDFYSSHYGQQLAQEWGVTAVAVQHHHAHLMSVAAEHQHTQPAIGIALDGFGLGAQQQAWGGELFYLKGDEYQHLASLSPLKQPGGDVATREPWRMAAAVLVMLGRGDEIASRFDSRPHSAQLAMMIEKGINTPPTSSAGRLFDAAASLLDIKHAVQYEGQAAMMLESLVTQPLVLEGGWCLENNQLDFTPLLESLIDCDAQHGANLFHGTLVAGLAQWIERAAQQHDVDTVMMSGGCFLNRYLNSGLREALAQRGLKALLPRLLPVNDGGISLGQAWTAGLRFIN